MESLGDGQPEGRRGGTRSQGSVLYREKQEVHVRTMDDGTPLWRPRATLVVTHEDMVKARFWEAHPHLLAAK
jgi:hypothetical protein